MKKETAFFSPPARKGENPNVPFAPQRGEFAEVGVY